MIVHSGSRGVGWRVAQYYMKLASGDGKAREGHYAFHVKSKEGADYFEDVMWCQEFALSNRLEVSYKVIKAIRKYAGGHSIDEGMINRNHNHVDFKDGLLIHRKGATHAELGMDGVIPGNMRDGCYIVRGLGNEESLCLSSHGAGRLYGRKLEKWPSGLADMEIFKKEMQGIVANVSVGTMAESPLAYKSIEMVMEQQEDLVEVIRHVKPIINIKSVDNVE